MPALFNLSGVIYDRIEWNLCWSAEWAAGPPGPPATRLVPSRAEKFKYLDKMMRIPASANPGWL
jgi:hypothetical protein